MADNTLDTSKLKEIAEDPLEAEEDGTRYKAHSLKDLIAMDNHLAAKQAVSQRKANPGLRFAILKPPGCI